MTSLRRRTLWLVLGLMIFGTALIAIYNFHDSSHEIAEIYDAQLAQNARLLQGVMQMPMQTDQHEQLYQAFNEALSQAGHHKIGHPYESKMAFQVWGADGQSLVHSASTPAFEKPLDNPGFSDLTSAGHGWRGFLLPDEKLGLRIWVGERDDVRQDLVDRIVRHTLLPNVIGILLLAVLVWLAIGWGLKPLQDMAQIIRGRHPESLDPLHLVPLPKELEPMQAALNRLLFQVESMLQRERRFIGDAAHELRTPLAVLHVHAQNALQAPNDIARNEALNYMIVGVDRLTRVVNQLLIMARVEPELAPKTWRLIDLEAVVRETLVELTSWVLNKGLELSLEVQPGSYRITSDGAAISIALQNLLTNAANFSPAGGELLVHLSQLPEGEIQLSVKDMGPGIDEQQLARLFERFYSQGNPQGAGLGLSIVEMIAKRLGGSVMLKNDHAGGLLATLKLPGSASNKLKKTTI
ncbi:ATP-binding protein [Pseudomonas sp. NPDC078700]|uniref:ATP-binding protein n=1 Tax=Pseudomonas sp. NPDC078700 TaxID=3364424 RepID=UPI0037CC0A78